MNNPKADFDVIVVGAGFAGLYGLYQFRDQGLSVQGFEAASGVGGVWYHNRYPGARCDVDSIDYSFSFSPELQREWAWTERYAAQPEILAYLDHVADRFDLRRLIRFSTRVTSAHRNDATGLWTVGDDQGGRTTCRFLVLAIGCLSTPRKPPFEGLDDFQGEWFMTAQWPHEPVDLAGKRVGLIGTGSSGVQSAPEIAKVAEHLYVFQRTPVFTIPARNHPTDPERAAAIKARYEDYRREQYKTRIGAYLPTTGKPSTEFTPEERQRLYAERWTIGGGGLTATFTNMLTSQQTNDECAEFVRERIREIVEDPKTAELLCPYDHPIGARRICIDTDYYDTYNRPNVTLVDVRSDPIERITRTGLQTRSGAHYPLDVIVFAIGFDAVTGAAAQIDIRNGRGEALRDKWAHGPKTYLGLMTADFPNLFMVTGPGSPSVLVNMVPAVEHDIRWISELIRHMDEKGLRAIEASEAAEGEWVEHVAEVGARTLLPKAKSWYMGDNVAGKTRMLLAYCGGFNNYTDRVEQIVAAGYEGFAFS